MFKYKNGLLPDIFTCFFSKNNEYHTHMTQNAAKLITPLSKTQAGTRFIKNMGVGFWNLLENNLTDNLKIGSFKKLLNFILFFYIFFCSKYTYPGLDGHLPRLFPHATCHGLYSLVLPIFPE
jgi:hypothetical protein